MRINNFTMPGSLPWQNSSNKKIPIQKLDFGNISINCFAAILMIASGLTYHVSYSAYIGCFKDGGTTSARAMKLFSGYADVMQHHMTINYCVSLCLVKGENFNTFLISYQQAMPMVCHCLRRLKSWFSIFPTAFCLIIWDSRKIPTLNSENPRVKSICILTMSYL